MDNVCGYFRVSREDTALDKFAVDRYRSSLIKFGVEPENIFCDFASGGNVERDDYQKMLAAIRNGSYKKVVVPLQSRLNRNVLHSELLAEDLAAVGAKLIILESGRTIDPSDPEDRFNYQLNAMIDHRFLANITKTNLNNAKHMREKKGINVVPFGYVVERLKPKLDREPFVCLISDKSHISPADVLLEIIDLVIESGNLSQSIKKIHYKYGVADYLPNQIRNQTRKPKQYDFSKDRRFKHRKPLKFTHHGLKSLISNPLLKGDLDYFWRDSKQSTVSNPGAYPDQAIISRSKFNKLQKCTSKTKLIKGIKRHIYPFTSLVWCGLCGAKCYSDRGGKRKNGDRPLYYFCKNKPKGCPSKRILASDIEKTIIKKLTERNSEITALTVAEEMLRDTPEIVQLEKQLQSLIELPIKTPEINSIIEQTKIEINTAREQLKVGANVRQENIELLKTIFSNPLFFETLPIEDKREIYHLLVNKIVISVKEEKAIVERIDLLV